MIIETPSTDLQAIRGTALILLAAAISKMFPTAQLVSGEANELGFYYDFIGNIPTDASFTAPIEETMRGLAKSNAQIDSREMMRENAADFFVHKKQTLKADLIADVPYNIIELIELDGFFDLAPSRYIDSPRDALAFTIFSIQKVDIFCAPLEQTTTITRISGTAFSDSYALKKYVKLKKAYKNLDHLQLVKDLNLFTFEERVSTLSPIWLPGGVFIRRQLEQFLYTEQQRLGIAQVITPILEKIDLFIRARLSEGEESLGVLSIDEGEYTVASTPIIAHASLFQSQKRSVDDLPVRYAEIKKVYVQSNVERQFWGFHKTKSYENDFTHLFCTEEQFSKELDDALQLMHKAMTFLGLKCKWKLIANGKMSEKQALREQTLLAAMQKALVHSEISFTEEIDPLLEGGPKLQGFWVDLLEREWEGPRLCIDRKLPKLLGLSYKTAQGKEIPPFVLKYQIYGPLERLLLLLAEKGLPLQLAPTQAEIFALGKAQKPYAEKIFKELRDGQIRAALKVVGNKDLAVAVQEAERKKIPFLLILGDKEAQNSVISLRRCGQTEPPVPMSVLEFLQLEDWKIGC